jgi:hypothetical protein
VIVMVVSFTSCQLISSRHYNRHVPAPRGR